ncbi:MAG TPA: hypothetical protein VNO33_24385 [Kofleriaceae bacterium]|nr:hypothetical protein [Kofleriaceae bacterium]
MRSIALAAVSLLAAACSGSGPTAQVSAQHAEVRADGEPAGGPVVTQAARGQVIAEIQFRDHVLVVRSLARGRRFDVQSRSGALLASSLTRDELDRKFPAIGDHFRDSTAIHIDATLDRQPDEPTFPP